MLCPKWETISPSWNLKRECCGEEAGKCGSWRMQRVLPALSIGQGMGAGGCRGVLPALCPGHDMGAGGCWGSSQHCLLVKIWELEDAEGSPRTASWIWCGHCVNEFTGAVVTCTSFSGCWGRNEIGSTNKYFFQKTGGIPPPPNSTKTFLSFCILIKFLSSIFHTYLLFKSHYWFHFKIIVIAVIVEGHTP